ncbi:hypothetical protein MHYP_G00336830 [Metynnis hypsauchen]
MSHTPALALLLTHHLHLGLTFFFLFSLTVETSTKAPPHQQPGRQVLLPYASTVDWATGSEMQDHILAGMKLRNF